MEASSKDRPPMLAPGNYVQWKSRIKRYIDTKPNHELIHYCLKNPPYKFTWADKQVLIFEGSPVTRTKMYMETYKNVSQDIHDQLNAKAEAVQIILTWIDNDIYSTVVACPNACEMWKAIEWFVTLVKQSQELKTVSYHKLYNILKQHHNEVNEIRAERIARVANPLALVAQQQPVYHPQNHPTHYTQNSSTRSQQAATMNRGKDKEIDKLVALISLSFKKIYKPTNNNLRTSSNTSRANQNNSSRINRSTRNEKQASAHQETISILSQQKKAHIKLYKTREDNEIDKVIALENKVKLYKTREDNEIDKVIALENKVKVLDNIVYKTDQSVQMMNMLNNKCRTSFAKPEFLKKAQRANPRLYDIGCNNDNLALMLAPESDEVIRLEKESRSKLSDLIRPFDYDKLNNLYDLFVPQREKSSEQRYFSERSRLSHTPVNNGNLKDSFNKQTTLLEKRMDESIP
nr:hypothetical protein [Tanacetum cinerariifolium]